MNYYLKSREMTETVKAGDHEFDLRLSTYWTEDGDESCTLCIDSSIYARGSVEEVVGTLVTALRLLRANVQLSEDDLPMEVAR